MLQWLEMKFKEAVARYVPVRASRKRKSHQPAAFTGAKGGPSRYLVRQFPISDLVSLLRQRYRSKLPYRLRRLFSEKYSDTVREFLPSVKLYSKYN